MHKIKQYCYIKILLCISLSHISLFSLLLLSFFFLFSLSITYFSSAPSLSSSVAALCNVTTCYRSLLYASTRFYSTNAKKCNAHPDIFPVPIHPQPSISPPFFLGTAIYICNSYLPFIYSYFIICLYLSSIPLFSFFSLLFFFTFVCHFSSLHSFPQSYFMLTHHYSHYTYIITPPSPFPPFPSSLPFSLHSSPRSLSFSPSPSLHDPLFLFSLLQSTQL